MLSFAPPIQHNLFQALGQLFQGDLKLYICPAFDTATGKLVVPEEYPVAPHLRHLYAHLLDNHLIETVTGFNESLLRIYAREVLARIQGGDAAWEMQVPASVTALIKQRGLFGYRPAPRTTP